MLRGWFAFLAFVAVSCPVAVAEPVKLIFDTDMDSDCDDAGAMAMLHALADRGEIEILATTVSSHHPWSAPCVDAINTYYGRPDLPIGVPHAAGKDRQGSRFARKIADSFPRDTPVGKEAPDAVQVLRRVLAAAPDQSVVFVTVGDLTNPRHLLESAGDEFSALDGRALVAAKVTQWVCMGSRYPADLDPNPWGNFKIDPESTVEAIENWPTPILFTGGGAFAQSVATGKSLEQLPSGHPVRRVYELYFNGPAQDRHSADQIAVYVAARGHGAPWKQVTFGHNHIFPNGTHEWRTSLDNPQHSYISALADEAKAKDVAAEFNRLMLGQSAP